MDALSNKQAYLDGWGETNSAVELGKMRVEISNWDAEKAILIPQKATNGDVMKALFPKEGFKLCSGFYENITKRVGIEYDWWNRPYKGVEE